MRRLNDSCNFSLGPIMVVKQMKSVSCSFCYMYTKIMDSLVWWILFKDFKPSNLLKELNHWASILRNKLRRKEVKFIITVSSTRLFRQKMKWMFLQEMELSTELNILLLLVHLKWVEKYSLSLNFQEKDALLPIDLSWQPFQRWCLSMTEDIGLKRDSLERYYQTATMLLFWMLTIKQGQTKKENFSLLLLFFLLPPSKNNGKETEKS